MLFVYYPKCTTCQKAKKWLDDHNVTYECRDIKEQNPDIEELREWHKKSDSELKKFFNTSGILYRSMNLKDKLAQMSQEEQLQLLASDGMLVKRPLLITDDKVLIGFRESAYEELL